MEEGSSSYSSQWPLPCRLLRSRKSTVKQRRVLSLVVIGLPLCLALLWPGRSLSLAYSNLGSVHQSQEELSLYTLARMADSRCSETERGSEQTNVRV